MATQVVGGIQRAQAGAAEAGAIADQAEQNANASRQQTSANEDRIRHMNRLRLGEQRANAAQSGFDPSSGSIVKLQGDSAGQMELDALTQRYEGNLRSMSLDNEAKTFRSRAKSARTTGFLNVFGTLAQGAGSYFGAPRIGPPAPVETRKI